MTTDRTNTRGGRDWVGEVGSGILGGLVGGLAFGGLMAVMAMLPMIGMLAGREDALVGFAIHMLISATIGAIYGALFGALPAARRPPSGAALGLAYGFAWWVLGPLLIMPSMMGMGPQFGAAFNQMNLISLMGHLVFGLLLGVAFALIMARRDSVAPRSHAAA